VKVVVKWKSNVLSKSILLSFIFTWMLVFFPR
jgi:hypothetical protein